MKFALVNGEKKEAKPGTKGICPVCEAPLIPKCGNIKVHHWAHSRSKMCDPWWENESPWHRAWKNLFPPNWQEVVHFDDSGEKHIADVKTSEGWVIEFQHSPIKIEEKNAREVFYKKLIWIVDGTRRKMDIKQFIKVMNDGAIIIRSPIVKSVYTPESRLLKEWVGTNIPVFLDFGEATNIWCLLPGSSNMRAYVAQFSRKELIDIHRSSEVSKVDEFNKFFKDLPKLLENKLKSMYRYRY